jgi:succinylglutamate desuccinylase
LLLGQKNKKIDESLHNFKELKYRAEQYIKESQLKGVRITGNAIYQSTQKSRDTVRKKHPELSKWISQQIESDDEKWKEKKYKTIFWKEKD